MGDIADEVDQEEVTAEERRFRPNYPKKAGEEGTITELGLRKKIVLEGEGWDTPELGDEVTVSYSVAVEEGEEVPSSDKSGEPIVFRVGHDDLFKGCEEGLITMKKGEVALFTLPPQIDTGARRLSSDIPQDSTLQIQVELLSWFKIADICEDGGILKKILWRSEKSDRAKDHDEVTIKYEAQLQDGTVVARSPEEGVEFLVSEGHLCPAMRKTVVTMRKGEKAVLTVQPQYAFGNEGRPAQDGFGAVPSDAVLSISVEVLAFKLLEYVTEDKKIIKKIMNPIDKFEKPNSGATVHVRYTARLADGTIFDKKGLDGEEPFEFKVDEEQVFSGLDLAVATMKYGEIAIVIIHPDYGFGDAETRTTLAVVPPVSTLYYEIEMVSFTKVKESWDMKPEEKIEYAAKRKEEGNAYFKAGKFQRAAIRYDMAAKYVEFDSTFSDEQKETGRLLRISSFLNHAASQLKLKEFRKAASLCSEVLALDSNNFKALYRRAQAYTEAKDFDLAELDLRKAQELEPDNREVGALLVRVKKLQAYYDKKESKFFTNMIEKLAV